MPPPQPVFFSPQLARSKRKAAAASTPMPRSSLDSLLAASNLDVAPIAPFAKPAASSSVTSTPTTASASLSALAALSLNSLTTPLLPAAHINGHAAVGASDSSRRSLASTFRTLPTPQQEADNGVGHDTSPLQSTSSSTSYPSPPRAPSSSSSGMSLSPNSSTTGAAVLLASLSNSQPAASSSPSASSSSPSSPSAFAPVTLPLLPRTPVVLSNLLTPSSPSPSPASSYTLGVMHGGLSSLGISPSPSHSSHPSDYYSPAQQLLSGPLIDRDPLCAQAELVLMRAAMAMGRGGGGEGGGGGGGRRKRKGEGEEGAVDVKQEATHEQALAASG